MADIDKVTKGLECHKNGLCQIDDKTSCPYWECEKDCSKHLMGDALELLKEQQPKKPHYTTLRYIVKGEEVSVKHPECPKCIKNSGLYLWDAEIERGQAFCKRCGQAIDWSKDGEQE